MADRTVGFDKWKAYILGEEDGIAKTPEWQEAESGVPAKDIRALAREGMSFLVSSHNMLEVEFLSDRVAIMSGGRILACAAAGELKREHAAGNLEEVFMRLTRP